MSSSARDLLVRGVAAAKAGDIDEARFYLEWVLRSDADRRQQIDAWWWLSEISNDPVEKRGYLENILSHDMGHGPARRSLAIMDGRLDRDEVIDPTHRPIKPLKPKTAQAAQTRQFSCPQCNGQMSYSPDGKALTCPYCHHQFNLSEADEPVDEQDFVVALATDKGHSHAVAMQAFQCQGCGAPFVVAPTMLSMTCPYCASAHVIKADHNRQVIEPEGIIPFSLTEEAARRALQSWLKDQGLFKESQTTPPVGLYAPVWTFDVGGEIQWRQRAVETRNTRVKSVTQHSSRPVFFDDIMVPANRKFKNLNDAFKQFRLEGLVPYEPGYLADWPAGTYQVSAADASLLAREQAYERAREELASLMGGLFVKAEELVFSSAGLVTQSFKLILLPLWIIRYHYRDKSYGALVNGQTGHVTGKTPPGRFRRWLAQTLKL